MTFNYLRPAISMAIALILAGCGGKASFPITGTVAGLIYPGLVLSTNGMTTPVSPPPAGTPTTTFSFPQPLSYGEVYNVEVATPPHHQSCVVTSFADSTGKVFSGPTDTAGRLASINIGVSCSLLSFSIGGTFAGDAPADGLVLINGSSDSLTVPAGATTFQFAGLVTYNTTYGVSVLTQPATQTCSVTQNGSGTMLVDTDVNPAVTSVNNIVVTCTNNPPAATPPDPT